MRSILRVLACGGAPLALAACTTVGPTAPPEAPREAPPLATSTDDVPAAIAAPSSARLAVTLLGTGVQNYECRAKAGSSSAFEWVFVSPEAALKDGDKLVGRHYGGPTWEYGDGSKVTGTVVASTPAPVTGDIPWLLLKGSSSGTGVLGGVAFVQRVRTSGGVAPAEPCSAPTIGTRRAVRYTADYRFFRG